MMTDSSGKKIGEQGHYPFGESWYLTNTTTKWEFTSYERDAESGNDYAMARYGVNRLGRFSSPDLLAGSPGDPQSLNRYAYVRDDSINLADPFGLQDCYVAFPQQPCVNDPNLATAMDTRPIDTGGDSFSGTQSADGGQGGQEGQGQNPWDPCHNEPNGCPNPPPARNTGTESIGFDLCRLYGICAQNPPPPPVNRDPGHDNNRGDPHKPQTPTLFAFSGNGSELRGLVSYRF